MCKWLRMMKFRMGEGMRKCMYWMNDDKELGLKSICKGKRFSYENREDKGDMVWKSTWRKDESKDRKSGRVLLFELLV